MIKPIDKMQVPTRRKTQKKLIEEDIKQAMSEGIVFFEFVDEAYNKKYLKQYVRDVADEIVRVYLNKRAREYKKSGGAWPKFYFSIMNKGGYLIEVSSEKKDGELHVYGEIREEGLEEAWEKYLQAANMRIESEQEAKRRRKERGYHE